MTIHTAEDAAHTALFLLNSITCSLYSVFKDKHAICGIKVTITVRDVQKVIFYKAHRAKVREKLHLELGKNEDLKRVTIGYDEEGVRGLVLETDLKKKSIGNVLDCDSFTEINHFGTDNAILGFEVKFNPDKIVELTAYSAPILDSRKNQALLRRYQTSLAVGYLNDEMLQRERYLNELVRDSKQISATFSEYQKIPRSISR